MTKRNSAHLCSPRGRACPDGAVVVEGVVIVSDVKASGTSVVDVGVVVGDIVVDVGDRDIQVVFCRVINHDSQKGVGLAFVLGE